MKKSIDEKESKKIEIIYEIQHEIEKQVRAEKAACERYIQCNVIGEPMLDDETRRDREKISFIIEDTFRIAEQIAVDAIRKAALPC